MSGFVGEVGFETNVGRARSFPWVRFDQVGVEESATDCGDRHGAAFAFEVPLDCVGAGVETSLVEFDAQVHDAVVHYIANPGW